MTRTWLFLRAKKNSISALFQSILRQAPLQSKYSSSEWINTKEKELTGIVQWKRDSFKFESPSVSVVECPPLDAGLPSWPQLDYVLRDMVPVFFETIQSFHHIVKKSLTPRK